MKTFDGFKEFNSYIKQKGIFSRGKGELAVEEGLTVMCEFLKEKAKEKFGHEQQNWAPLAEATQVDRKRQGYPPNEPLLRSGDLRDSISFKIEGNVAKVGSPEMVMVYQEKGTDSTGWSSSGIPPRPVLGLTQILDGKESVGLFVETFMKKMMGL